MARPKIDAKTARSLQIVRSAPELAPFLNFLRMCREAHRDGMEASPNERMTARHQGAAEELKNLLNDIENANETFLKINTATTPSR